MPSAGRGDAVPRLLRQFWIGSIALFLLALVVGWIEHRLGFPKVQYNPLGNRRHEDLLEFIPLYKTIHTAQFFQGVNHSRVSYPPLGAVIYAALYWTKHPVAVYRTLAALWLGAGIWGVARKLKAMGVGQWAAVLFPLTLVVTSFPIVGLLQQGNIELFMWISAAVGTWMFLSGREYEASVLWGVAGAIKLFPIILLAMLLPRRRWTAFAVGVLTFVAVTVWALWWLGPSISVAWHGSLQNVFGYQGARVTEWSWHEVAANHSAFGLIRFVAVLAKIPRDSLTVPYYLAGGVVLAAAFFLRLSKMPIANQLLGLTAFMVMFPPISFFYTLVHLYPAFLVLFFLGLHAERTGVHVNGLKGTVLTFLLLFASFTVMTFIKVLLFGGLIQALVLVMLFGASLQYRFELQPGEAGVG